MGACCSKKEKDPFASHGFTSNKDRKSRDVLCCIVFLLFCECCVHLPMQAELFLLFSYLSVALFELIGLRYDNSAFFALLPINASHFNVLYPGQGSG